jgi:hypothetical protein
MSERAVRVFAELDAQIGELLVLLCATDEAALGRPCPGREKLGDGTVAACASHTVERYQMIAQFLLSAGVMAAQHSAAVPRRHRILGLLLARGHTRPSHGDSGHDHDHGAHGDRHAAQNVERQQLIERLTAVRAELVPLAEWTDAQLNAVPPTGSFRFCDGKRTLEQVVTGLLKHQGQQVGAVRAALGL